MAYVRYRQLAHYLSTAESPHPERVNKAAFAVGLVAVFGMTLVANFQVCLALLSSDTHSCISTNDLRYD